MELTYAAQVPVPPKAGQHAMIHAQANVKPKRRQAIGVRAKAIPPHVFDKPGEAREELKRILMRYATLQGLPIVRTTGRISTLATEEGFSEAQAAADGCILQ